MPRKKIAKEEEKRVETKLKTKKTKASNLYEDDIEELMILQPVKGMRDILPGEQPYWQKVRKVLEESANNYGFARIDTPTVEFENLFERSIGEESDLIKKETYSFKTKGKEKVILRPEITTSIMRAYIQHGMSVLPKPVKLFSVGKVYRYDQVEEGRYREFRQGNFEIIGENDPVLDAQIIQMTYIILKNLGIKNIQFQVNSVGNPEAQKSYIKVLKNYFNSKKGRLGCSYKDVIEKNPLKIFDSKDEKCIEICSQAPKIIDHLDKESRDHFKSLLEYLDELELPYVINPTLVRGLDYYNRTVFEIYSTDEEGKRHALGGGGRYDYLAENLDGEFTPAIGLGLGMDRLVLEMKRLKAKEYQMPRPRVFLAQLGDLAKKKSLKIFAEIEKAGILVAESFGRGALKSQLIQATKLGVDVTLIIGQKEAIDGTIILKDMLTGTQETIIKEKIVIELKKHLKNSMKVTKSKK